MQIKKLFYSRNMTNPKTANKSFPHNNCLDQPSFPHTEQDTRKTKSEKHTRISRLINTNQSITSTPSSKPIFRKAYTSIGHTHTHNGQRRGHRQRSTNENPLRLTDAPFGTARPKIFTFFSLAAKCSRRSESALWLRNVGFDFFR